MSIIYRIIKFSGSCDPRQNYKERLSDTYQMDTRLVLFCSGQKAVVLNLGDAY